MYNSTMGETFRTSYRILYNTIDHGMQFVLLWSKSNVATGMEEESLWQISIGRDTSY